MQILLVPCMSITYLRSRASCVILVKKGVNVGAFKHHPLRSASRILVVGKLEEPRSTNSNLRYKVGRNLGYEKKEVFAAVDPEKFGLPKNHVSTGYVFARERDFFVYPNNYHQFVKYFKDTFQHGGVSLEEVIVPFAILDAK